MGGEAAQGPRRFVGPGLLLVLLTAVISGLSTFLNAFAVQGTNSDAFVTVRNLAVALMIAPVALGFGRVRLARTSRSDLLWLVGIGLVGGAVPFLLFFRGLQMATEAHGGLTASFLYRSLFLMASVLGVLWLKERFRWRTVLGAGLLLSGNYMLLSLASPVWTDGSLFVLVATALWAVEYSLSKRLLSRLDSGTVALGRMGFGAVFLVGFLLLSGQLGAVAALTAPQWSWVAISAVLLALFVTTWYAGLQRVDLGIAASVLVLGFPITWILSISVGSVRGSAVGAAGALAVAAGVLVMVGLSLWRESRDWLSGLLRRRSRTLLARRES